MSPIKFYESRKYFYSQFAFGKYYKEIAPLIKFNWDFVKIFLLIVWKWISYFSFYHFRLTEVSDQIKNFDKVEKKVNILIKIIFVVPVDKMSQ